MAKLPCFITAESADSPRCIVSEKFDFSPRIHTRAGTTRSVDGEQIVHRPHPHAHGNDGIRKLRIAYRFIPPRAHGNNDRQNYQNGTFEHTPTRARE